MEDDVVYMIKDDVPLISVIVPVYNVEKYLARCIESILNQTYKNIEIILVDDGSTDRSGLICDNYANTYINIHSFHQNNQGQAVARNYALDMCKGEFIGFVDADDYIALDMYEYLYHQINKENADCASVSFCFTTVSNENRTGIENIAVYDGETILYKHLIDAMKTGSHSVCRCLFKRNVLENVRFPIGIVNEDIPFKFKALSNVNKFVDSSLIKYYYYQKGESTTRGGFKEKDLDLFKATELLLEMAEKYSESVYRLAKGKHLRGYFSILARIAFYGSIESKKRTQDIINICQANLRDNCLFLLSMPLPLSRKILIVLFCINFNIAGAFIWLGKQIMKKGNNDD